jgi:hypothetical protein
MDKRIADALVLEVTVMVGQCSSQMARRFLTVPMLDPLVEPGSKMHILSV